MAMTRVVAFLRAINVGGHVVKKERLVEAFESLGFKGVASYKQAGNVIFEAGGSDLEGARVKIEKKLRDALGYDVEVFIRSIPDLRRLVEKEPRGKAGVMSCLVTFLPGSTPSPLPRLPLVIPKSTAEVVSSAGNEVFSLTHVMGEGGLPNQFLESKLKAKMTTGNMNVVREIVEKFG
jgi:uncharacterized protein (DUF1697 family)